MILVNEHTSGAGEMVAAFAQENSHAAIIGTNTPGRLLSGSAFKAGFGYIVGLPIAAYLTWEGRLIEGKGVAPGVNVEMNAEQLLAGEDRIGSWADDMRGDKAGEIQRKASNSALLLPGIAEPQRPTPFLRAYHPGQATKNTGSVPARRAVAPMQKYSEADGIEKQLRLDGRKRAILRWAGRRGSPTKK